MRLNHSLITLALVSVAGTAHAQAGLRHDLSYSGAPQLPPLHTYHYADGRFYRSNSTPDSTGTWNLGRSGVTCPMPVAHADSAAVDSMPVARSGVTEPMPVAKSGCWNPLDPKH
jgi:hypothetical protein